MQSQSLNLKETKVEKIEIAKGFFTKAFWKRQFQIESTKSQKIFDWTFGIILPVICFVADPLVFKGGIDSRAMFGTFKPFAYLLNFTLLMGLSAWLIWGAKLKWLNSFLAGLFLVGGIVSLGIGLTLAPFSLIGLLFIIGILGFTPLFTSFVYLRNAVRSFNSAKIVFGKHALISSFVLSAILSVTIPALVNLKIYRGLESIKHGNIETIRATADRLKYVAPLIDADELGGIYCDAPENEREQAIAEAYLQLSGENIETVNYRLCND